MDRWSEEREALRRSLYTRHPDPRAMAVLLDEPVALGPDDSPSGPEVSVRPSTRRLARLLLVGAAVLALAAVALAAIPEPVAHRAALPKRLDAPAAAGEVLASWSSVRAAGTRPSDPAYQPSGYSVVRSPDGPVRVAIRCVGRGTVTVEAGRAFVFRCPGPRSDAMQRARVDDAFIVTAHSTGRLMWAATVTAGTAGREVHDR